MGDTGTEAKWMNESRQIQDPEAADATESVGGGQGGKWGGGLKISA